MMVGKLCLSIGNIILQIQPAVEFSDISEEWTLYEKIFTPYRHEVSGSGRTEFQR